MTKQATLKTLLVAAALACVSSLHAQPTVVTFTATTGNFFDAAVWDSLRVPGAGDITLINNGGTATIAATSGTNQIAGVRLGNVEGGAVSGTVVMNGGFLRISETPGDPKAVIGFSANMSKFIMNGGTIFFDGPDLNPGNANGKGVNELDWEVGEKGLGRFEMHGSSVFRASDDLKVAENAVGNGSVLIDGNAVLSVGSGISISSGGTVQQSMIIAGNATVDSGNSMGAGSPDGQTDEGYLTMATGGGNSKLTIQDNAKLSIRRLTARQGNSLITVKNRGQFHIFDVFNSTLTNSLAETGPNSTYASLSPSDGTLILQDDAVMTVNSDPAGGPTKGLGISAPRDVGNDGGTARLIVRDRASFSVVQSLNIGTGAAETSDGTLTVVGPNASVSIGTDLNLAVDIDAQPTLGKGTLNPVITGPTHTTVNVTGIAHLSNGTLKVSLQGYLPQGGEAYTLLRAGTIDGEFKSVDTSEAALPAGLSWSVTYTATEVRLSVTGSVTGPAYQTAIQSQRPVGYWRLNETTPSAPAPVAPNLGSVGAAGNGTYLDGALRGAAGALAGDPANTGMRVNGDEKSRVRIPYAPEWNANAPFSVEFWAKPGQTATAVSPGASVTFTSTTRSGWLFYQADTAIGTGNGWYFRLYRGGGATATRNAAVNMNLDVNKWYHVVGVFDGTNVKLYVDGQLAASVALADTYRPVTDTTAPMTFGSRSDGASAFTYFPYVGTVDEPAFYTKALTDAQVLAHYQAGATPAPATPYDQVVLADGPAGYWRLNEAGDPPAVNLGTLGAEGDGTYVHDVAAGQAGSTASGFEAANKAVSVAPPTGGHVQLPPLNLYSDTVTITAWVKANGVQEAYAGIVTHDDLAATVSGINVGKTGGRSLGYTWANAQETYDWESGLTLPDNQWAFVALAVSPASATLVLHDGTLFQTTNNAFANPPQAFSASTRIGNDALAAAYTFNGSIDEVAIFDRTLSLGELYTQWASAVGGVGPRIFAQPQGPTEIFAQETLTLQVDAGGTPALTYQWRKDGSPVGSNSPIFTKANLTTGDSGTYVVEITNPFGTVASIPVVINVQPISQPQITQQPVGSTVYQGGTINLSVTATGGNLKYRWQRNGSDVSGATTASYTVPNAIAANAGTYTVIVSNALNTITSTPAVVNVIVPATGSFEAAIVADGPQAWWKLDDTSGSSVMADAMGRHHGVYQGNPTLGVTGAVATSGANNKGVQFSGGGNDFGEVPYSPLLNSQDFTVEAWARVSNIGETLTVFSSWASGAKGHWMYADGGGTWRGGVGSGGVNYYVPGPTGDDLVAANEWVHLALVNGASGLRFYVNGIYNGVNYADFDRNNSAPLIIGGAPPALSSQAPFNGVIDEVAVYTKALTQAQLQAHVQAALYGNNSAPVFLAQPQSQKVAVTQTARFIAKVGGTAPISLQWLNGETPVNGATSATLTITNVTAANQGAYKLRAWNTIGTNDSTVATLTVVPLPTEALVTNQLVLHLKFDGNANDASGRANNGAPQGNPGYVAGAIGTQALKYSTEVTGGIVSAANYVTLGTPSDLNFGTDVNFSVSYWIRMTNSPGDLPVFCNALNSYSNPGFTFAPSYGSGGWSWSLGGVGIYGEDDSVNDGQWHHVLSTFDRAGNGITYLDGLLVDSRPVTAGGDLWTGQPITIGQDPSGEYPEAGVVEVDDLGVWRRVLDPFEAFSIYYVGKTYKLSFDEKNPVGETVNMTITPVGGQIEIGWSRGTLQESSTVSGGYTDVQGATAPTYRVTPGTGNKFYRVLVSP